MEQNEKRRDEMRLFLIFELRSIFSYHAALTVLSEKCIEENKDY